MESNKETDVEAPPTYEEAKKDEKPLPDEKPPEVEKPSGPPLEEKIETKFEGNVAPGLGDELESRGPCCCACCCGYKGCTIAIGIICLVLACMEFLLLFLIFGLKVWSDAKEKNPDWKSTIALLAAVAILAYLIVIFNIIINIILIVGAVKKNRKLVLVWIYGTICIVVLIFIKGIISIVGGMVGTFIMDLFWIGLLCYFIWVVWMFQKLKCKK